ncbi:hypothetical protein, partial [Desulfocicer niacini]
MKFNSANEHSNNIFDNPYGVLLSILYEMSCFCMFIKKIKFLCHKNRVVLFVLVIGLTTYNYADCAEVAGINFTDNAFADVILSTDFTGTFGVQNGAIALSLEDCVLGSNLNTWMEYGAHDLLPGEDGDYNSDAPPDQYVEVGFLDNNVFNGPGNDMAFFEVGTANSILVALDLESLQNPYNINSRAIVVETAWLSEFGINVGYVDLSDLGVAWGEAIDRVFVSSALGENGEVYWYVPGFPNWGVPEFASVGALYTELTEEFHQVDVRINNGSDDVEEGENGNMLFTSSDLELVNDAAG